MSPNQSLQSFLDPGRVERLRRGELDLLHLSGSEASIELAPHGAHLLRWQPRGLREVLFMSGRSAFAPDRAIRGGVPIIFPWFGARTGHPEAPAHGFARTTAWTVREARVTESGRCLATLVLADSPESRRAWDHAFELLFQVEASDALCLRLVVKNTGASPFGFEAALHTYFAVSDVRETAVGGLRGTDYLDKAAAFARRRDDDDAIRFGREIDRMYVHTASPCTIDDPGWKRRIRVAKAGSLATVVWNPGPDRAKALADLGEDHWTDMVCVETAVAGENAVVLEPGDSHPITTEIRVAPLGAP